MADVNFTVDAFGVFGPGRVRVVWRDEPRPTNAPLDALVDRTWAEALHEAERSGAVLFNGQLARYLRHRVQEEALYIEVGPTDYAQFMSTNYLNHARGDEFGWDLFSNPIGTTATLVTRDGWLLYGRRSKRVACHAGYVHTFGGGLEAGERNAAREFDVFGSVRRELAEELGLRAAEISSMVCLGLIRDATIRQPELIFDAHLTLTRAEVETRLVHDRQHEHDAVAACRDEPDAVVPFVLAAGRIAPVAVGALCQHGRQRFGEDWYAGTAARTGWEVKLP
ncbi:MAG: hypothetical protein GXY55_20190 [Phycisphaerae bacterium]|nr:hypothetical protein [Phycisphaerae bacterium]